MNPYRARVNNLERDLAKARAMLQASEAACRHEWGEVERDFIYTPGYIARGDGPEWHGADKRHDQYVSPKTTKRWKRTCAKCGKVEHTQKTVQTVKDAPVF